MMAKKNRRAVAVDQSRRWGQPSCQVTAMASAAVTKKEMARS